MFNLEQLRMFVEAVDAGSFSACARKLGKAQSAVSQGIANLEIDLNIELFDRKTRKPHLTEEGARLLIYARSVLQQVDNINIAAQAIHQGEELHLRLALEDALLVPHLGDILKEFGERFQATSLDIISAPSPDMQAMIKSNRADIGLRFLEMEIEKGIEQCYIGNLPFYAVCSPQHLLANLDLVSLQDLAPHRQIIVKSEVGKYMEQFPPLSNEIWTTTHFHPLIELVTHGIGWSYLPSHLVEQKIKEGQLHQMTMSFDHKHWSPPVELLMPKNKVIRPALLWLSKELKNLKLEEGVVNKT